MSTWVKTDVEIGCNVANLTASNRVIHRVGGLNLMGLLREGKLEEIEKTLYDLIEEIRPEWAGGVLFAISYDTSMLVWRFTYCHRLMPANRMGERLEDVTLFPDPVHELGESASAALENAPTTPAEDWEEAIAEIGPPLGSAQEGDGQ